MYAERYVPGTNITFTDNADGTKSINAENSGFVGLNIVEELPNPTNLISEENYNKVYFVY